MKSPLLIACILFLVSLLHAQKSNNPLYSPYKIEKDTVYARVDHEGNIINLNGVQYIRKSWPEKDKWHENLYNATDGWLVRDAFYRGETLKEKDGICLTFYGNGMLKDSGLYVNNKRQGKFMGWFEDGMERLNEQYKNGYPTDTCLQFFEEGALAAFSITDDFGNGMAQVYYPSGKVKMIGRLREGKREDDWVLKREDGTKQMQINYLQDSITLTQCFNETGSAVLSGDCIYEKPASFPGGIRGWSTYLSKNLKYPNAAIDKNIEAIVRVQFIVGKDGSVTEVEALGNPDKLLADEAIRLIKKSPKWEPAIQYNKAVIYRHIQGITFRLK